MCTSSFQETNQPVSALISSNNYASNQEKVWNDVNALAKSRLLPRGVEPDDDDLAVYLGNKNRDTYGIRSVWFYRNPAS